MATASTNSANSGEWKKRSVVSSFLLRGGWREDQAKPEIALFERSDKVSTYRNHLAAISGTIDATDPSPLSAALREIREETTLAPPSILLFRQGKPFTFRDPSIRREWTIHPFLFQLQEQEKNPSQPGDNTSPNPHDGSVESQIRIDWEHTRFLWLDPTQAVRDIETRRITAVPRLEDSLRRVWFEADLGEPAGAVLRRGLAELANDHESGANALARRALTILWEVVAALENAEVENDSVKGEWSWWWDRIRMAGWHLWKNGRESMGAAILSALLGAMGRMEKAAQETGSVVSSSDAEKKQTWKNLALRELDAFLQARNESSQLITTSFSAYLTRHFPTKLSSHDPLRVLTLSDSATIYSGLRHAALNTGFLLDLRVLESRPLYEGVSLAAALANDLGSSSDTHGASQQHKVTLYTDASAALAAAGVDIVVIGADRIAASGAVSNKTGSLPAVLAAKQVAPASKVVVLGGTEKIAPPGRPEDHVVEDNDPKQVSRAWLEQYNSARVLKGAETLQDHSVTRGQSAVSTKIHNIFFEWVPQHLIDAYITESGEWTQEHISHHSTKLAAEEEHIFAHL